jgi:hypothetical protein
MLAGEVVLAILFAGVAFGYYRAGAAFDPLWRWRTRQEDARQYWASIVLCAGLSLILMFLALRDALAA